jgi:cell division septum initiation protein DivIVA
MVVASLNDVEQRLLAEQEEVRRLREECGRLRVEAQSLASERDQFKAALAEAEKERDGYRKSVYAYVRKEFEAEGPKELERRINTEPASPLSEVWDRIAKLKPS